MSDADLQALRAVAGPVSRETYERLTALSELLLKWNSRINLVGSSTAPDILKRHILDSAQLWPLAPNASAWLDLGSGAGFPGLVLAIFLKERIGSHIDLVESNRKKSAFLQTAIGQFALPARVLASRIEDIAPADVDVVTARALAPLPTLLGFAEPWLARGASGLFHKGRDYRSEIAESAHLWAFDLVEHPSVIEPNSVILQIRNLRRL